MPQAEPNPMRDRPVEERYRPAAHHRDEHAEGSLTRVLEEQTAKIPSSFFLALAIGSMALSAVLEASGRDRESRFVGMWAPTLLTMGLYNKVVKMLGPM